MATARSAPPENQLPAIKRLVSSHRGTRLNDRCIVTIIRKVHRRHGLALFQSSKVTECTTGHRSIVKQSILSQSRLWMVSLFVVAFGHPLAIHPTSKMLSQRVATRGSRNLISKPVSSSSRICAGSFILLSLPNFLTHTLCLYFRTSTGSSNDQIYVFWSAENHF